MTIDQFEMMTSREREVLADHIALELLKPSHDFMCEKRSASIIPDEAPVNTYADEEAATRRARTKRIPRTRSVRPIPVVVAHEKLPPFKPIAKPAASGMTFERTPIDPDRVRGRALEERTLTDFNSTTRR